MLSRDTYLASIERDAARFGLLDSSTFDVAVPSCPAWDVRALIDHVGYALRYWGAILRAPEGQSGRPTDVPDRPLDVHPLDCFKDSTIDVLDALHGTPPTKAISWVGATFPASLVCRRIAHELAIHRWDAQAAAGTADGFDGDLAADGVDEVLDFWVPIMFDYPAFGRPNARLRLQSTDSDIGWLIAIDGHATLWRRADEAADVTAHGALAELYLAMWGRPGLTLLEVQGDRECLARWQDAAAVTGAKLTRTA